MKQKINKRALWGFAVAFIFLSSALVMLGCIGQEEEEGTVKSVKLTTVKSVKLTIVYDNNIYDSRLKTDWGFSCLVEMEDQSILFDTGGDSNILLYNMEQLQVDIAKIKLILLSHVHEDHTGGLSGVLKQNSNVKVYIPSSFNDQFKQEVRMFGAEVIEVTDPVLIDDGIATIRELGAFIIEQALLVNTPAGLVVITGCAHPGIVDIVRTAKELTNLEIYLVFGGFHLRRTSESQLSSIIQDFKGLGVQNVVPSHCSGDRTRQMFHTEFGNRYIEAGVGTTITIDGA
ncbi:MAG: MBL fold metallo-hydrolase [Candidatus Heimdallarchaeota archaeon]